MSLFTLDSVPSCCLPLLFSRMLGIKYYKIKVARVRILQTWYDWQHIYIMWFFFPFKFCLFSDKLWLASELSCLWEMGWQVWHLEVKQYVHCTELHQGAGVPSPGSLPAQQWLWELYLGILSNFTVFRGVPPRIGLVLKIFSFEVLP